MDGAVTVSLFQFIDARELDRATVLLRSIDFNRLCPTEENVPGYFEDWVGFGFFGWAVCITYFVSDYVGFVVDDYAAFRNALGHFVRDLGTQFRVLIVLRRIHPAGTE